MFEEAQLYAPVTKGSDGVVEVQLASDHPGVDDPVYRADSPWGKEVVAVAVINADLMVRVADAVGGLQSEASVRR